MKEKRKPGSCTRFEPSEDDAPDPNGQNSPEGRGQAVFEEKKKAPRGKATAGISPDVVENSTFTKSVGMEISVVMMSFA